jgi:hypothetical protein
MQLQYIIQCIIYDYPSGTDPRSSGVQPLRVRVAVLVALTKPLFTLKYVPGSDKHWRTPRDYHYLHLALRPLYRFTNSILSTGIDISRLIRP